MLGINRSRETEAHIDTPGPVMYVEGSVAGTSHGCKLLPINMV